MNSLKLFKPKLDKIMALNQVFKKDPNPNKINLIIGAYHDKLGKSHSFECVNKVNNIKYDFSNQYLPIEGDNVFLDVVKNIYFSKPKYYNNVQTLSGTGGLSLIGHFLASNHIYKKIYLPSPTWGNHFNVFDHCGLDVAHYYYPFNKTGINFEYLMEEIDKIPSNQIILLHACAHNPTGYDPDYQQWRSIIQLCKSKGLFILIDFAYLGFASGDITKDRIVADILNEEQYPSMICCSFAKNFGLYNSRIGTLFFTGSNNNETELIKDNLISIIRKTYSSPPSQGSNVIKKILNDEKRCELWNFELKEINKHYTDIRQKLRYKLENKFDDDFTDITSQKGMFYYSLLDNDQVMKMREKGIYFPDDGRISLAGINDNNIDYIVDNWERKRRMPSGIKFIDGILGLN